MKDNHVSNLRL